MLVASKGVLVKCDPSIKALIIQIDADSPGIILEELDDTHLLIQQDKVNVVKNELNKLLSKNIYNPFEEE
ncbi:TFIIH complex subunit tfb5 [Lodderomyces elongisporus]|uniref:General transcription and DNA repair factor IIH subunit TFB5 n=1 Tax=Lodderomyces elongisporus (strain ATCC 11503 / CBS 2605 / JCM 1781 / NBRC 1676 / NRRL YB-4239) TaxID=379508 RepID=A5E1M2_LODEL|nr:TFIIH complex subunit tfb5 [Lodderomyces elongisporus]EDK45330.1 RNA polymerase II transcription factor B subunit 5 [Lodderomyces elongisporus NRRL YB-4239]WLF79246.1 TFIIH complex subunit tfb5 [Lodderomyces elongisporus]